MKKRVKLTESTLHRIIKESVKRVLREGEDNDNYYGGGLPDRYFDYDDKPNDYEDFEGQPAWNTIDTVLTQNGVGDLDINPREALSQITKSLQKLDACMSTAVRDNGLNQNDVKRFIDESLPNYRDLFRYIDKLQRMFGWMCGK